VSVKCYAKAPCIKKHKGSMAHGDAEKEKTRPVCHFTMLSQASTHYSTLLFPSFHINPKKYNTSNAFEL